MAAPLNFSFAQATALNPAAATLVHVVLNLGHDVLGALDRDRQPFQVGDLNLLLELFTHSRLLRLGTTAAGRMAGQAGACGKPAAQVLANGGGRAVQRVEPVRRKLDQVLLEKLYNIINY